VVKGSFFMLSEKLCMGWQIYKNNASTGAQIFTL